MPQQASSRDASGSAVGISSPCGIRRSYVLLSSFTKLFDIERLPRRRRQLPLFDSEMLGESLERALAEHHRFVQAPEREFLCAPRLEPRQHILGIALTPVPPRHLSTLPTR